ncbi:MAG: four helix bundle protein [Bacteroidota bacterium]
MDNKNLIVGLSFDFALEIIEYAELLEEKRKYVIAKQLLKSGTSIGANIREAQSAESKADFIHKFKIADKEVRETEYWLLLCQKAKKYPNPEASIMENLKSINNIVSKIIITSKRKK